METGKTYPSGQETLHFLETLSPEESDALARQWRTRLLHMTTELHTTPERRDWLLHMTLQSHALPDLWELVERFNHAQHASPPGDVIDVRVHPMGLYFGKQAI